MNGVRAALIAALAACGGREDRAPAPAPGGVNGASGADKIAAAPRDAGADAAGATVAAVPRDDKTFHAALSRGRERARRHDWSGAVQAFEAALAAAPGDARALTELGWAAFRAGDLGRAEQASSAASTTAGASARVRAASFYNLGRVKEAKGDRAGAADAYRASLALRLSRTVRRHLRGLGRALAGAMPRAPDHPPDRAPVVSTDADDAGDAEPAAITGPFASIDAFCAAQADAADDADGDGARMCVGGSGLAAGPAHADGPPEVAIVGVRGALDDVTCLLAFHGAAGWYLWDGIPCETTTAAGTDWAASLGLDAPAAGRVIARFAVAIAARDDDGGAGHHACEELIVSCEDDIAPPRCTPAVPVAWATRCPDTAPSGAIAITWDATASWSLAADALVVAAPSTTRAAPDGLAELAATRAPLR